MRQHPLRRDIGYWLWHLAASLGFHLNAGLHLLWSGYYLLLGLIAWLVFIGAPPALLLQVLGKGSARMARRGVALARSALSLARWLALG